MNPHIVLAEMKKMLSNLDGWLTKASAHAEAKKFDPAVLIQSRLAPDMFPLVRQIQSSCDTAKFAAARISGKEPPSNPDTETTFADLEARIAATIAYLDTITAADVAGAGDRTLSLPRWEGKSMNAVDYFVEHAIPNFFFHVTMTYAILRHAGVDLGKRDYLGAMSFRS
jgi:hypothetical protein